MKKNNGYTLVEMIIVISIIVLLAAMAVISMRVLGSASAKDKAVDFDTDIAALSTKARNMDANFTLAGSTDKYDQFCLVVFKTASGDSIFSAPGYYRSESDNYYVDCGERKKFSSRIGFQYSGDVQTGAGLDFSDGESYQTLAVIRFNRRGECVNGYGTYSFTTARNNTPVATTKIRKNGSHETK